MTNTEKILSYLEDEQSEIKTLAYQCWNGKCKTEVFGEKIQDPDNIYHYILKEFL